MWMQRNCPIQFLAVTFILMKMAANQSPFFARCAASFTSTTSFSTKENGTIYMEPQTITLFIDNLPINALSIKEFLSLGIVYEFKSIYDVLKEKDFSMRVLQINGNDIPYKYSNSFLSALKKYKWN